MSAIAILIVFLSTAAHAHDVAGAPDPQWAWNLDPLVTVPVALLALLYVSGAARLWRRAGAGRGIRPWQAACFAAGWSLLVGAGIAPLHWLGERLFVAHMIEHEIMMAAAAPLIVLSRPGAALVWSLPPGGRAAIGRIGRAGWLASAWSQLSRPLPATLLHGLAIWIWHVPPAYQAALASEWLHWLQHLSFLGTAMLFWRAMLRRPLAGHHAGSAFFCLFATALHTSLLGVLLVFAREPVYPAQSAASGQWGLTPLEDQQLAGLVMWIPGGLVYAAAALALAGLWIAGSSASAPGRERHAPAR
jgi:cytochrome c oxidase assembly factor CtaG